MKPLTRRDFLWMTSLTAASLTAAGVATGCARLDKNLKSPIGLAKPEQHMVIGGKHYPYKKPPLDSGLYSPLARVSPFFYWLEEPRWRPAMEELIEIQNISSEDLPSEYVCQEKSRMFCEVLQEKGIPSRLINGRLLGAEVSHQWVMYLNEKYGILFEEDPTIPGYKGGFPIRGEYVDREVWWAGKEYPPLEKKI